MKFLLCPGKITSITDGEEHFIGSRQLLNLYKIDKRKHTFCDMFANGDVEFDESWIRLYPLEDGNYDEVMLRHLKNG